MTSRRAWCFTENEHADAFLRLFYDGLESGEVVGVRYFCAQLETAPTTGQLHCQAYVELSNSRKISWLKKHISQSAHWEPRFGTREQARDYCQKPDTAVPDSWVEWGVWIGGQGARTDMADIKDMIERGAPDLELANEYFQQYCQYRQSFRDYRALVAKPRGTIYNVVYFGPSGVGKSRLAHETYPKAYEKPAQSAWFDLYAGEEVILWDDHNSPWLTYDKFMKVTDRYPVKGEVKGGFVQLSNECNVFTTTKNPYYWYCNLKEHYNVDALMRRISAPMGEVRIWQRSTFQDEKGEYPYETSVIHDFSEQCSDWPERLV